MRRTWQRELVLRTLYENGGAIRDSSGQATSKLHNMLSTDSTQQATTQMLSTMEDYGLIERDINGKRCYAIVLKEIPKDWKIIDPAPNELHIEQLEASIADMILEDSYVAEPISMADKLLEKIKHSIADLPDYEQVIKDLEQQRDHYKHRVAELLEENNRIRYKLDPALDEVKAQKEINAGLRRQILELENNIRTLAKNDSDITRKMKNLKDFQRFISEAPRPGVHA